MRFKQPIIIHSVAILFLSIIMIACEEDQPPPPAPRDPLVSFYFAWELNDGLIQDIKMEISDDEITGTIPLNVDITSLTANFGLNNATFFIDGVQQVSGETVNDFSRPVIYTLVMDDGISKDYTVDALWFTGLPIVYIFTDGNVEIDSKYEYFPGSAEVFGGRLFDNVSGTMEIRGRGHSSWYTHPKKPYQLKFDDKSAILGMPADKKWIFLAEYSDKTLIRNKLAFEMGHLSNLEWTPLSEYAEVFVNDDHRGVYLISQKVEESSNRLALGDNGYLMELDVPEHLEEGDVYFTSNHFTVQIKEPEVETGSQEYIYAKSYVNEFETALYSDNFTNPETGYRKYADVESFIDWYLINEIAKNQDSKDYSSMYFTLMPGGKIKMGPLWDFDLGFGNVNYSECEYPEGFWVKDHAWIHRMFDDPEFAAAVKIRFQYFKSQKTHLLNFVNSQAKMLQWAQDKNNTKWDLMGRWVWPNAVVFNTYLEEVNYLNMWLSKRIAWLDEAYE